MFQKSKQTIGEGIVMGLGVILVFVGALQILPGVTSYHGTIFARCIIFLFAFGFTGFGLGMIWLSAWSQKHRQMFPKTKLIEDPYEPPLEGVTYRKAPRPRLDK